MGNEINELDDFIRQQMEGYKATPPQGVFEGIDQAVNSGAASSATTGSLLSKGIGKIILGIASAGIIGSGVYLYQSGVLDFGFAQPDISSGSSTTLRVTDKGIEAGSGKMEDKRMEANPLPSSLADGNREAGRGKQEGGSNQLPSTLADGTKDKNKTNILIKEPSVPRTTDGGWTVYPPVSALPNGIPKPDQGKSSSSIDNSSKKIELTIEGPSEVCPGQDATYKVTCNKKTDALLASFDNEDLQLPVKDMKFSHKFAKVGKTHVIVEAFVGNEMFHFSKEVNVQPLQTSFEVDYRNYPELRFVAKDNAEQYRWSFGENDKTTSQNEALHRFELPTEGDSQVLEVRLKAKNNVGCQATFAQPLTLYKLNEPIIPNVFTPNGDGLNDRFEIYAKNSETYHLSIYDRMGMKVFESNSPDNTWDGSIDGHTSSGTYYYQFEYRQKGMAMPKTISGSLAILKQN